MSTRRADTETAAFVLLGNFNPAILQPSWLVDRGVVTAAEAETGQEGLLVSAELTSLQFPDLAVEVLRERLTVFTTPSAPTPLIARDAAVGILQLLPHTPVRAVGINLSQHLALPDGAWLELQQRYAAPDAFAEMLEAPGLRSLTVQGRRTDGLDGSVRLTIEPSMELTGGVWCLMNSHIELPPGPEASTAAEAAAVLEEHAEQALASARAAFSSVSGR